MSKEIYLTCDLVYYFIMKYISDINWKKADENFKLLMPIILIFLATYIYISFISNAYMPNLKIGLEITILIYFAIEIGINYILSEDFTSFIKNHWIKIVLLIPFLRVFRVFGIFGNMIRYVRVLPYLQKFAKIPKMLKITKLVILIGMFKTSIIKDEEKIKKEKEKITKK